MFCIYKYTNIINGKTYVGKTKNLKKRHIQHCKASGSCPHFHAAIRKYGSDMFKRQVIKEKIEDSSEADILEKYYIGFHNSLKNGYNISPGGECGRPPIYDENSIKNVLLDKCSHREASVKYSIPFSYVRTLRTNHTLYPHLSHLSGYKDGFVKKLKKENVIEILSDGRDKYIISEEYGVKPSTIDDIRFGRTWKHVTRYVKPPRKRAHHTRIRLTEDTVLSILKDDCSHKDASERYNVNYSTVRGIRCNSLSKWKYIDRSNLPKYKTTC